MRDELLATPHEEVDLRGLQQAAEGLFEIVAFERLQALPDLAPNVVGVLQLNPIFRSL